MMAFEESKSARDNFGKFIHLKPNPSQVTRKDLNQIIQFVFIT